MRTLSYKTLLDRCCFHSTILDLYQISVCLGLFFVFLCLRSRVWPLLFGTSDQSASNSLTATASCDSVGTFSTRTSTTVLKSLLRLDHGSLSLQVHNVFNVGLRKTKAVLRRRFNDCRHDSFYASFVQQAQELDRWGVQVRETARVECYDLRNRERGSFGVTSVALVVGVADLVALPCTW
jgi:hypothetical protein